MKKYFIVFPGIGYTKDKPLLYYSRKLAMKYGYKYLFTVKYPEFSCDIKNDIESRHGFMSEIKAELINNMHNLDIHHDDEFLLLSKSIGTVVASEFSNLCDNKYKSIYFTPLAETFDHIQRGSGIVFHGTNDSWADTEIITKRCRDFDLPLYITIDANHSLEAGDVTKDILEMQKIMDICEKYIKG